MDDGSPTLEVGFAIDVGDSFGSLTQLDNLIDSATANAVAEFAKVERASRGMLDLGGATASVRTFGAEATRELQSFARESAKAEKAGEAIVRQLERQNAAFGKTRDELRSLKAEEAARAADAVGNDDLANRLRAQEASLYDKQFAAQRRLRQEAEALAEEKIDDARRTVAAALAEEQAVRSAARAYEMFNAVARQKMAMYREQQAAEAAVAKEADAARQRAAAEALVNAQLLERSRIEAALERTTGVGRPRAVDAGATFSALAAKAAEDDARAQASVASAAKRAADEHGRLAAMVRDSHAAQMADATAAEQLRLATDPLYAATKRLNYEIAESTRLYHAGATAPAEYARQQEMLSGRLRQISASHDEMTRKVRGGAGTMTQLSFQLNDIATMAAMGAKPMQIFASQAGQIFQIAQMADGGVKGFARQIGGLALTFAPAIAAAAVAGVAIYRWQDQINDDAGIKKFAQGLGLTNQEMKKLGDQSVTTGDLLGGLWKTITDGAGLDGKGKSIVDALFSPDDAKQVQGFVASIYGFFAGGYDAIVELWGQMSTVVSDYVSAAADVARQFFAPVVSAAEWAGNAIGRIFSAIYDWAAGWLKSIAGAVAPILSAIGQGPAATAVSGAGSSLGKTFGDAYAKRVASFVSGSNAVVATIGANAVDKAQERLRKKADEIKADRTPKKNTGDRHADQLIRDAQAIEAQIKNLYHLADAYGVSGAAALIAEARVKAESQAIKQRGDIEAAVDRQVRLSIAQRVSDAAKASDSLRDQATAQERANAMVAAGVFNAADAAEMVKAQIADLPLLTALQAAQQRGLSVEADRARKALDEQRAARNQLNAADARRQVAADMVAGDNRLAELREELRLVGATDAARVHALATIRATQEAQAKSGYSGEDRAAYVAQQVRIADLDQQRQVRTDAFNTSLHYQAELLDVIAANAQRAAQGMADAFGTAGRALGDLAAGFAGYLADKRRLDDARAAELVLVQQIDSLEQRSQRERQIGTLYALRSSALQIGAYGDMASAAKGFFKEGSGGYEALATAEKAFRAIQFALSVRAIAQDAIETGSKIANSVARTATGAVEAVVNAIKSLPFPLNIAAGAATIAALASIGVSIAGSFGGGGSKPTPANTGTGTVLGDTSAKSDSIRNAIDALKEVDTVTNAYAREMSASLKSIDSQIGGLAAVLVRSGDINASSGVTEGFKANAIGSVLSKIPLVGGLLGGLFGSKTTVTGSGLFGGPQSLASILGGGFQAQTYSDIEKTKKFLGITTGKSYSTQYASADPALGNQFTLILKQFNDAIVAAAGPLGSATTDIQNRLNGFVVNIGKIDLKGLTGEQIQEKLTAIFGAAADSMANAAFPGLERFQQVGEGAFETLVRVASTVEAVTNSLDLLGASTRGLVIDAKMGLASQFESVSDFTSAAQSYFEAFYSKEEQAAAKTAQLGAVFGSLGLTMPSTLAAFRQLVEAQNLTTAAGQATYATLLQLAPAFADLQASLEGAKSAADIASERQDLQRQILELQGDTAAIRALDLAKLDASNRALQEQIYAIQDAQAAAQAADELRQAWKSVGDSIMDEVKRIRGLADAGGSTNFAALMSQFNVATAAARGGDQDAAKNLPGLSQALLSAAALAATSRQELDRVQSETAASLEATNAAIGRLTGVTGAPPSSQALLNSAAASRTATATTPANDDTAADIRALKEEIAGMRRDNNAGHAATAGHAGKVARVLEDVTTPSGGQAISVTGVAA